MQKKQRVNPVKEFKTYKTLVIARSGYGKTQISIEFMKQLIENKEIDPRRLVIFSQTIRSDPKQLKFVKWLQSKCGKDYDYQKNNTAKEIKYKFLEDVYNTQEQLKEGHQQYHHWFIWFDDQIIDIALQYAHPIMRKFAFIGRHYGGSMLFNMQVFRSSIDASIREQVTNILIGDLQSDEKKLDVIRQFSAGVDQQNPKNSANKLFQAYQEVLKTNNGHGFLNIHTEKQIGEGKFEINLSGQFLDQYFLDNKEYRYGTTSE